MDEVLKDLGAHGQVSRRLTETGQLAVAVDTEGEKILSTHPLVGSVGDDSPDPATGGTPTTVPAAGTATTRGTTDPTTTPAQPDSTSATTPGERRSLIVNLNVEWTPESQLSAEAVARQRARIEVAQDQVVLDLGGHGQLSRRLTETAQMAVSVDERGAPDLVRPLVGFRRRRQPGRASELLGLITGAPSPHTPTRGTRGVGMGPSSEALLVGPPSGATLDRCWVPVQEWPAWSGGPRQPDGREIRRRIWAGQGMVRPAKEAILKSA